MILCRCELDETRLFEHSSNYGGSAVDAARHGEYYFQENQKARWRVVGRDGGAVGVEGEVRLSKFEIPARGEVS